MQFCSLKLHMNYILRVLYKLDDSRLNNKLLLRAINKGTHLWRTWKGLQWKQIFSGILMIQKNLKGVVFIKKKN